MTFGRVLLLNDGEKYPTTMQWKGTEKSAREIAQWARDEALLPYAAVTPPDRNAAPGTPAAGWSLKLKVEVPASQGGGTQWVEVPQGATIQHEGTRVDPVFTIQAVKAAAETFKEEA